MQRRKCTDLTGESDARVGAVDVVDIDDAVARAHREVNGKPRFFKERPHDVGGCRPHGERLHDAVAVLQKPQTEVPGAVFAVFQKTQIG